MSCNGDYTMIIKRAFIVEGGDRKFVDVHCSGDYVEIHVLGVEPLSIRPRRFSRVYDRVITRIITLRSKPLEIRRYKVKSIGIAGVKRLYDREYVVLDINGMVKVFIPSEKIRFIKECIRIIKGS